MNMRCAACGSEVVLVEKAGFRETCPSCDAWLHSCINCAFWVREQCTEPSAEKVRDPEGMNFCDWYREKDIVSAGKERSSGGKEAAEEMWKKLTKK